MENSKVKKSDTGNFSLTLEPAQDQAVKNQLPSAAVQSFFDYPLILKLEAGHKYFGLIEKARIIAKGLSHALMVMGDVGVAKSTIIRDALVAEGLEEEKDFVFVRGYSTPMALYERLYQNRQNGKIVIIDDCDAVLKNKTALDIFKAVLDDKYQRKVSYETKRKSTELPKTFIFAGKVIFITNFKPKEDDVHFLAIQDRCILQKLYLTPREKLEYIEKIIVPSDYKNSTLQDRQKIFGLMREIVVQGGIHFSYRTFFQLLVFYSYDPVNFNIHLSELLPCDTDVTLLLGLMKSRPGDREHWQQKFMETTGKSRRTYFYCLEKCNEILPAIKLPN